MKIKKKLRISCENHNSHKTLGGPFENQENFKNQMISCENIENHENHRVP